MSEDQQFSPQATVACVTCGGDHNLTMLAHRDDRGRIVGWVFVCTACLDAFAKNNGIITIRLDPNDRTAGTTKLQTIVKSEKE